MFANEWMDGWTGQTDGWMDGWVEGGTLLAFGEAKAWSVGRVRKATFAEHFCMPGIPPAPFCSAISAARVPADRAVSSPGCGRPSSEPLRSLVGFPLMPGAGFATNACIYISFPSYFSFQPGYLLGSQEFWGFLSLASPVPQTSKDRQAYFS